MTRSVRKTRSGFTLVECIATMVVLTTIGSVASMIAMTATDSYLGSRTAAQINSELHVAISRLHHEISRIELDTSAGANIKSVTSSSMTWRDSANATYSVTLSGDTLQLVIKGGAARTLLKGVTSFSIQAFDQDNAPMAASLSGTACRVIRRVAVSATVERNGVAETLGTKIFITATRQTP